MSYQTHKIDNICNASKPPQNQKIGGGRDNSGIFRKNERRVSPQIFQSEVWLLASFALVAKAKTAWSWVRSIVITSIQPSGVH
jgi:hypothetical protein